MFQSFQEIEKDGRSKPSEEFPLPSDAKANVETQEIKILIEGEQDRSRGSSQVLHIPVMIEEEETGVETERLVAAEPGLRVFGPSSGSGSLRETDSNENGLPEVFFGSKAQKTKSRGRVTTPTSTTTTTTKITTIAQSTSTTSIAFSPTRKAIRNQIEFKSSTEDLQERIRKLKETVRKTKESLTSSRVVKPGQRRKKKRKRVKGRKRVQNPGRGKEADRLTIVYPENISLPTFARQRPRQGSEKKAPVRIEESNRSRGRGRLRRPPVPTTSPPKDQASKLERELEEKYGKTVVANLFNMLMKAVSHPDKDRILKQLKSQLASMSIGEIQRLQFGVQHTDEVPTSELRKIVPGSAEEEDVSLFDSVLDTQLKRVEGLAQRLASRRKNTEREKLRIKEGSKHNKKPETPAKRRKSHLRVESSAIVDLGRDPKDDRLPRPQAVAKKTTTTELPPTATEAPTRDEEPTTVTDFTTSPTTETPTVMPLSSFTPVLVQVETVKAKKKMFNSDRPSKIKMKASLATVDPLVARLSSGEKEQLASIMEGLPSIIL